MKFIALIGLAAAVTIRESPDCPESTSVFSYNERRAAAAGLVQTSACDNAGVAGVTCDNLVQFATGMAGDEDLGQDIIMKGDKFHYNQQLAQFATGMAGDEDLGQNIIMKGDKYHYNQKLAQIPTCTDRHVVNCQPVCDESQTTGCTESRTPTSYPMRTWDWRDR